MLLNSDVEFTKVILNAAAKKHWKKSFDRLELIYSVPLSKFSDFSSEALAKELADWILPKAKEALAMLSAR